MSVGKLVDFDMLDTDVQQLIREGKKAREFAYSPYSNFQVGSVLRCKDGSLSTGCNVENASFSMTICAERCALAKAVSDGRRNFSAISVVANSINGQLTTPCGACRQSLTEFGNFPVYISNPDMHQVLVTTTYELLPYVFKTYKED